jgi:hypothetical protein
MEKIFRWLIFSSYLVDYFRWPYCYIVKFWIESHLINLIIYSNWRVWWGHCSQKTYFYNKETRYHYENVVRLLCRPFHTIQLCLSYKWCDWIKKCKLSSQHHTTWKLYTSNSNFKEKYKDRIRVDLFLWIQIFKIVKKNKDYL